MKSLLPAIAITASLAITSGMARAEDGPDTFDGGILTARNIFDCVPGPGYLKWTSIDVYQRSFTQNLFLGTREICQAQAERLYQTRSVVDGLAVVGICVGQGDIWYLKRWSIDYVGFRMYQGQTYYGPLQDCMVAADLTNSLP